MAIPNNGTRNTPEEQIQYSEDNAWDFPKGAVLIKHFELGGKRLETRFEVKGDDDVYYYLTYKWNAAQTDASIIIDSIDEDVVVNGVTQSWHYPSRYECASCHFPQNGSVLGPKTRNLNKSILYPSSGIEMNQLVNLSELGILNETITNGNVNTYPAVEPKNDNTASLENRARAYLDVNCASCHNPNVDNIAMFDARYSTAFENQNIIYGDVIYDEGLNDPTAILDGDNYRLLINDLPVGNYIIEGVSTSGNHQKQLTIERDYIAVSAVNLNLANGSVQIGEALNLIATVVPNNATNTAINWSSTNTAIATVNPSGTVTGIAEGDVATMATSIDGGFTATATISVTSEPVSNVIMLVAPNPADYVIYTYFSSPTPLEITSINIYNSSNNLVKVFNDPSSLLVDGENYRMVINDLPIGNYILERVNITGNYQKPFSIEREVVPVTGMSLDISSASITIGEIITLPATISPNDATDQSILWSSSNTTVATVNANGIVTGVSEGEVTITATTNDGSFTASATITVTDVIMLIAPNPATFVFYVYFYSVEPLEVLTINIYDQLGRLVKTFNDPEAVLVDGGNYRLLIEELPSGNYFIEGVTSGGNYQKQAVKE